MIFILIITSRNVIYNQFHTFITQNP